MSKTSPLFLIVTAIIAGITALPATAQHCEVVGCWSECHPIPGGRRCREVCRRRCWHPPAPRYDAQPQYYQPQYVEPVRHYAPAPSPHGALVALGVLLMIVLVIVAACSGSDTVETIHKETDAALRSTDDAQRLAQTGNATAEEIDRYIEAALKEAYERGRAGEDRHG